MCVYVCVCVCVYVCVCVCVCVCIKEVRYVYYFINASFDGHLGCTHILATVNNAAINTGMHVYFKLLCSGFSGYIPRSGITGSYGSSSFNFFEKNLIPFSTLVVPIYILQNSIQFSLFFTSFPTSVLCVLFDNGFSDRCEVIFLTVVLIYISLMTRDVEHFFFFICLFSSVQSISRV